MLTCIQYTIFLCNHDKLMFSPSNHLINFTHAHLHVIHMAINWISTKMRPWCMNSPPTCMPWSWQGVQKVWDHLVGPARKTSFKLALRQTRMVRLVHGSCGGMHEMTPIFWEHVGMANVAPRQGVHEFGHNTHVASRRGTVLGFYHRKTPTKCIVSEMNGSCQACLLCSSQGVHKSLVSIGETEKKNLLVVHGASGGIHATVPTRFDLIIFQVSNRKENL